MTSRGMTCNVILDIDVDVCCTVTGEEVERLHHYAELSHVDYCLIPDHLRKHLELLFAQEIFQNVT